MALTITIDSVDKTSLYPAGKLTMSEKLDQRMTAIFPLIDTTYEPEQGAPVIISDGATTHFSGIIQRIQRTLQTDGATFFYRVTCGDYSYLLQQRFVVAAYDTQTLKFIVEDIIDIKFGLEGFDTSTVLTGPTIDKAIFNYVYAADAFDQLADITGYHWYVDVDKKIHFEERTTTTAAFNQTDISNNFLAGSLTHTTDKKRYRNVQIVRAGTDLTGSRVETLDGNNTRVYTLIFPVGEAPTVKVNTVSKTVGVRGIDTGKEWYWQKNDHQITQDDGDTVLDDAAGDEIEITYKGLFQITHQSTDGTEMAARAAIEGGSGEYEQIELEPDLNGSQAVADFADGLLRRYGAIPETVNYETDGAGLKAGTLQTIDLAAHNIDDTFMITEVSAQDLTVTDGYLRYTIKGVTGEFMGGWEKFFKDLTRGQRKILLRESEAVSTTKALADTLNLGDATLTQPAAAPETRAGFATVGYSEAG